MTQPGRPQGPRERLRWRERSDPPKPMGTPRQLLNLYLGEAYRYRLAMNEQLPRIETAAYELRLKPDTDVFARVMNDNWGEKARAMNEVQFFFVAVRGILSMASAMKEVASEDVFPTVYAKLTAAMDRFDRDAPHAKDMRDFLTHLDAYMAGTGHKELPNPEHRVWLAAPEGDLGLYVGGVALSVAKTASVAERLALDLRDAVREVEQAEHREVT